MLCNNTFWSQVRSQRNMERLWRRAQVCQPTALAEHPGHMREPLGALAQFGPWRSAVPADSVWSRRAHWLSLVNSQYCWGQNHDCGYSTSLSFGMACNVPKSIPTLILSPSLSPVALTCKICSWGISMFLKYFFLKCNCFEQIKIKVGVMLAKSLNHWKW